MAKKKAITIFTTAKNAAKSRDPWDKAIADAQEMIEKESASIAELRRSIRYFEELRDSGAAFPGASKQGVSA
jgi:hypothetical protein